MCHARPYVCRMVVHHDHVLDLIHDRLLDALSPRASGQSRDRADRGRAFSDFLGSTTGLLMARVAAATTPGGLPIVRFEPTLVCERLNPLDGNGKPEAQLARSEEREVVRYWSMTPPELVQAASGEQTWEAIYEADAGRIERHEAAAALADELLEAIASRSADRTGSA